MSGRQAGSLLLLRLRLVIEIDEGDSMGGSRHAPAAAEGPLQRKRGGKEQKEQPATERSVAEARLFNHRRFAPLATFRDTLDQTIYMIRGEGFATMVGGDFRELSQVDRVGHRLLELSAVVDDLKGGFSGIEC